MAAHAPRETWIMIKDVILVTGAPRSGTTPLGELLSLLPGAVNLYEPMGLTGDSAVSVRFPMPGEPGFSNDQFTEFVGRLRTLDLRMKSQVRPGHAGLHKLAARLLGTRSLQSLRRARLTPFKKTLIWKDPHAIFCEPVSAGPDHAFRRVITVRPPLAHAASFKRLGWVSSVGDIYQRYRAVYGGLPAIEKHFDAPVAGTAVGSSALLWHIVHARLAAGSDSGRTGSPTYLFNLAKAESDEMITYENLFTWLRVPMTSRIRHVIERRAEGGRSGEVPEKGRVHDFNRSAAQANGYWRNILTEEESDFVLALNESLWERICSRA
jgi:hypothetical protein